jgi:Mg-chelatase subunit ChlD
MSDAVKKTAGAEPAPAGADDLEDFFNTLSTAHRRQLVTVDISVSMDSNFVGTRQSRIEVTKRLLLAEIDTRVKARERLFAFAVFNETFNLLHLDTVPVDKLRDTVTTLGVSGGTDIKLGLVGSIGFFESQRSDTPLNHLVVVTDMEVNYTEEDASDMLRMAKGAGVSLDIIWVQQTAADMHHAVADRLRAVAEATGGHMIVVDTVTGMETVFRKLIARPVLMLESGR